MSFSEDTEFYERSDILNNYTTSQKNKFLDELRESIVSNQSLIDRLRNEISVYALDNLKMRDQYAVVLENIIVAHRSLLLEALYTYDLEKDLIERLTDQLGLKTDDIDFLDTDKIRINDGFIPFPFWDLKFGHGFNLLIQGQIQLIQRQIPRTITDPTFGYSLNKSIEPPIDID